jgi:hypothetical protein
MPFFLAFAGAALGGFFYRCRGGFIGLGHTQLARLIWWALPVALAMTGVLLANGSVFLTSLDAGAASGALAFVGLLIPHAEFQGKDNPAQSMTGMALVGAVRCALIMIPIAPHVFAMWFLPLFGAMAGPAYRHAWRFLDGIDSGISVPSIDIFGFRTIAGHFAVTGGEWGEVLTGAAIGFGIGLLGAV